MEKNKSKKIVTTPYDKIRKPTAPPTEKHGKDKYDRKDKYKKKYDE